LGSLLALCTAIHTKYKINFVLSACTLRKRFTQNRKEDFGSLLALCESDSHKIEKKILVLCFSSSGVRRQVSRAFAVLKFRWGKRIPT